ncbi:hypothetical protein PUV54_10455 [Hyphococcus flavus]|uniref:Uncharacterized protein n=1 Tax=Hyphococcus flavus TaxID=1866326 RepID=A0AAE9ZBR2_9PROT|nr:hypothetical protein [Hyphococcus flavus]WDI30380.1 hypothetical protein PUV54_10455 [Hyphococcus flavus]
MRNLFRSNTAAMFALGAGVSISVILFPWLTFMTAAVCWTAMRTPQPIGIGATFNISPAKDLSNAAYEGLCAAVALVFGVTLLFEAVTALA